jgi:glycosyltransferase involved in cell wall biosynthesis
VRVIRNGVKLDEPAVGRPAWRARLKVGDGDFVATMLAAFRSDKDHRTVLLAWRHFLDLADNRARSPRRLLVLAGHPADNYVPMKALAFDLNLGDTVCFPGHVDDVAGLLAASDTCVFASFYEGSPNAVLESMAAGLLVVASDHPGLREALGPDSDECIAPMGDAAALAQLLNQAMTSQAFRHKWSARNRLRAAAGFSVDRMCHETAGLIIEGLGRS